MVKPARFALFALLATGGLDGCFDVHSTDLLVIDNFNDGDLQPLDSGFGTWQPYGINLLSDPTPVCALDMDTGDGSPGALVLSFTVTDPMDRLQQDGGAGLRINATKNAVDFYSYPKIAFDIKLLSSGDNPLPSNALIYLELGCSKASTPATELTDLYVVQGVPYSAIWQNIALTLDNFGPPPWLTNPIEGGTVACLQNVDSVRFTVDAKLPDGKTGSGELHLDNIVLE